MSARTDHVVILCAPHPDSTPGCYTMACRKCGIRVTIKMPVSVTEFSDMGKDFGRRHRDCSVGEVSDE